MDLQFLYLALAFLAGMFFQWFLSQPAPHVDHPEPQPPATDIPRPPCVPRRAKKGLA